jgi:hypothetical protein
MRDIANKLSVAIKRTRVIAFDTSSAITREQTTTPAVLVPAGLSREGMNPAVFDFPTPCLPVFPIDLWALLPLR